MISYNPVARLADRWHGWRDGKTGLPLPGRVPLSTPHRDCLIGWACAEYEQERLRYQAIHADYQRQRTVAQDNLRQAEAVLARAKTTVAELAIQPADTVLAQRRPGEERRTEEDVRRRRLREHARKLLAAEEALRAAQAEVQNREKELAATRTWLRRQAEDAGDRVRRVHARCHRRLASYRRELVHDHPRAGLVAQAMDLLEPTLPAWLREQAGLAEPIPLPHLEPASDPADAPGLVVSGLSSHVVNGNRVVPELTRVSFTQQAGTVLAILEPTRPGSIALFSALLGESPSSGLLYFHGLNMRRQLYQARPLTGFVPKHPRLHGKWTARRELEHAKGPDIARVCSLIGMESFVDKKVAQLSKGQRRRLSIATEAIAEPQLLLLDEPISGLGLGMARSVMSGLRKLAADGCAVLMTARSVVALQFVDQVLVIGPQGRVVFNGDPEKYVAETETAQ